MMHYFILLSVLSGVWEWMAHPPHLCYLCCHVVSPAAHEVHHGISPTGHHGVEPTYLMSKTSKIYVYVHAYMHVCRMSWGRWRCQSCECTSITVCSLPENNLLCNVYANSLMIDSEEDMMARHERTMLFIRTSLCFVHCCFISYYLVNRALTRIASFVASCESE